MSPHRNLVRRRGEIAGSPGQILLAGDQPPPVVTLMAYGPDMLEEEKVDSIDQIRPIMERCPVVWVNVDGLGDGRLLAELGELFGIHALALEDVVNVPQRPKLDPYADQLFVVLHMLSIHEEIVREQLSFFLGDGFVLSFQEFEGDPLAPVRRRIRNLSGRLRRSGADYLAYALVDAVIDLYFPVLERFQEQLEDLERRLERETQNAVDRIRTHQTQLVTVRRAVGPVRELTRTLLRPEHELITDETRLFLRDCHDHALEAAESIDSCSEVAGRLMNTHLSTVSHQANETMKVLTVIATIFMPLSFLAGIYGMNFDPDLPGNMPELSWPYGYPMLLGTMAVIGGALLYLFRRKGWF